MPKRYWFADIDDEASGPYRWQPCLETGDGYIPSLPIMFETQDACLKWMRETLAGAEVEDA